MAEKDLGEELEKLELDIRKSQHSQNIQLMNMMIDVNKFKLHDLSMSNYLTKCVGNSSEEIDPSFINQELESSNLSKNVDESPMCNANSNLNNKNNIKNNITKKNEENIYKNISNTVLEKINDTKYQSIDPSKNIVIERKMFAGPNSHIEQVGWHLKKNDKSLFLHSCISFNPSNVVRFCKSLNISIVINPFERLVLSKELLIVAPSSIDGPNLSGEVRTQVVS